MTPAFWLLAVIAVVVPIALVILTPRRRLVLALLAWTASPLAAYVGVVAWEVMTRPDVPHPLENALLGLSLISAVVIVPWAIMCAVVFTIGFALRRMICGHEPRASALAPDQTLPAPATPPASPPAPPAPRAANPSPALESIAPNAAPDRATDAAEWRVAHIGFEMDDLMIGGIAVWRHAWKSVDSPPRRLAHPAWPEQIHDFTVQEIAEGGAVVRFAVSELSNGVWGFYVPRQQRLETSARSADRSLRYVQRCGEGTADRPDCQHSWAVLFEAATGRVLLDCAAWPESRITGNADGSLYLRLRQDDGETLFRIAPASWSFRNQGEGGPDAPLPQLADTVARLRQTRTFVPPGPWYRHISPDGTIRIDSEAVEWGNSHWVNSPRVIDIASGEVVLDLWGTDWDAAISWSGPRRVALDFRRYHFGGNLGIELDLERHSYRITREPGAVGTALPQGPLSDARSAMEASSQRVTAFTAKQNAGRPIRETGIKPNPFAAWRTALVILLAAIVVIAGAAALSTKFAPRPRREPVLLRPTSFGEGVGGGAVLPHMPRSKVSPTPTSSPTGGFSPT